MPLTRLVADALGVVTICLVAVLILVGLFCIVYSLYFRSLLHGRGPNQLSYFSGPWIIRITFILLAMWWGVGEIIRLSLLRRKGRLLGALTLQWQQNVCKCYIVSSLGFAEPCLFLTLTFLLRASLQRSGTLSWKWNRKTAGFVLLYCLPMFILQLIVILIGPKYKEEYSPKLPSYFIEASVSSPDEIARCTYPLLSTMLIGLFATVITAYLFWLGRRMLHLVINKTLQKRVYVLIISISTLFPLRVILLGLLRPILSNPEKLVFDAVSFLAFLCLLCSVGIGICMVVYLPISDSLSLRHLQIDTEAGGMYNDDDSGSSLLRNRSHLEASAVSSRGRQDSVSFRTMENTEGLYSSMEAAGFVELSLFNPGMELSPPGSPRLGAWVPLMSRDGGGG